jgi:hypothetical protein
MKYMNVGTSKLNIGSKKVAPGEVFDSDTVPPFLLELEAVRVVRDEPLAEEPEIEDLVEAPPPPGEPEEED